MHELKILSDNGTSFKVGGYGVVFGGQDLSGDRFTKDTDFWMDRIASNPPVLYQHGRDDTLKTAVVGRVTATRIDDVGMWVEAQITAAKGYAEAIRELIAKGVLGWSSGAVPHLMRRVKSATSGSRWTITDWPIAEFSLTPTPMEPRTLGIGELKALAAIEPLLERVAEDAAQAELITDARTKSTPTPTRHGGNPMDLPDSAFAFIEGGALDSEKKTVPRENRHYAHHDETGAVDRDALHALLSDAVKSGEHPAAIAHLQRHAMNLAAGASDDAHAIQWVKGAAPAILTAIARLSALAEAIAGDRIAMEQLGLDTKSGDRINGPKIAHLKTLVGDLKQVTDWAENIERGEDGKARVDMFRHRLALLQLEEVS